MAPASEAVAREARSNGHLAAHSFRRVSKGERERTNSVVARLFPSEHDRAPFRVAPHNLEAEQALLGAILVNNEAIARVSGFLKPQHFYDPLHQQIYETTAELIEGGTRATPITLKTFFENAEPIEAALSVPQYLGRLAANAATIINARDYGRTIFDLATRRQLILIGEDTVNAAFDAPVDFPPLAQMAEVSARLDSLRHAQPLRAHALSFASDLTLETGMPDVVGGLIPARSTASVFGASRSAKTFFVIALLNSVARSKPFLGRETEPGSVLYVPLEGRHGVAKRILAAEREYGQTGKRFAVLQATGTLGLSPQRVAFADTIIAASRELTAKSGVRNTVICIDTLSRALGGEDENTASVMTAALNHAERITAATGATVIFVHHCGKDKERGMRGSYALFAGLDAVLEIEHDGQESTPRTVTIQKAKDGPEGPATAFTLRTVEVGRDTKGRPITSCVIQEVAHPGMQRRRRIKPGSAAGKALNELHQIVASDGGTVAQNHARAPAGVRLVALDDWRTACRRKRLGNGHPASEDRAFLRAVKDLSDAGAIGEFDRVVWLLSRQDQTKMGAR